MLLFSSALTTHKLKFIQLSGCIDYVSIVSKWAEDEWGYIRNGGIEYREGVMLSLRDNVYVGTFAGIPVAMFALLDHSFHKDLVGITDKLPCAYELMYVYVEREYRGFGFGKQILMEAKRIAVESGKDLILLDTLKSNLNLFYERHGAEVICEGRLLSHPTDVLAIKI